MISTDNNGTRSLQTFIIGPAVARNELLAYVVRDAARFEARICTDIAGLEAIVAKEQAVVAIVDSSDANWIEAVIKLQRVLVQVDGLAIALSNVRRGSGTERQALRFGVSGYFYDDDSLETLVRGLQALYGGRSWMSRSILMGYARETPPLESFSGPDVLSGRETEILALVCRGYKNAQIAEGLGISPNTVRTHLANLFRKIGATNRLQAVRWGSNFFMS